MPGTVLSAGHAKNMKMGGGRGARCQCAQCAVRDTKRKDSVTQHRGLAVADSGRECRYSGHSPGPPVPRCVEWEPLALCSSGALA